jgi:hypothetical protein
MSTIVFVCSRRPPPLDYAAAGLAGSARAAAAAMRTSDGLRHHGEHRRVRP